MNVKYQIFVSSTYEDLKAERAEVIKACLNMGHIPVGMEMFNAGDEEQWAVIARTIDQCDYYVVIVAHRYGSTTLEGLSFTEKEYDYAIAQGVPVLGFMIDDSASWPRHLIDTDQRTIEALQNFKTKIKQRMIRFWCEKSELQAQVVTSLATYININPRRGWVRAPDIGAADVAQALSSLTQENARLRQILERYTSKTGDSELDDVMLLLKQETISTNSGEKATSDILMQVIYLLDGTHRDNEIAKTMKRYLKVDSEDGALIFLKKLHITGIITLGGSVPVLTQLGRQLYTRLRLGNFPEEHINPRP